MAFGNIADHGMRYNPGAGTRSPGQCRTRSLRQAIAR